MSKLHLLPFVHERSLNRRDRALAQHTTARQQIIERLPQLLLLARLFLRTPTHRDRTRTTAAGDRVAHDAEERVGEDKLAQLVEPLYGRDGELAPRVVGVVEPSSGADGGGGRSELGLEVEHAAEGGWAEVLCDLERVRMVSLISVGRFKKNK